MSFGGDLAKILWKEAPWIRLSAFYGSYDFCKRDRPSFFWNFSTNYWWLQYFSLGCSDDESGHFFGSVQGSAGHII